MPYITQNRREGLDDLIDDLACTLKYDGDLNYVLFAICKRYISPSYNNYKTYIGELEECIAEIRRRLLGPHEDKSIERNGDIN